MIVTSDPSEETRKEMRDFKLIFQIIDEKYNYLHDRFQELQAPNFDNSVILMKRSETEKEHEQVTR